VAAVTLGEELDLITSSGQWRALDDLLCRLEAEGLRDARRWYRTNRAPLNALARDWSTPVDRDGVRTCCDLLAAALAPSPEKAAAWLEWDVFWRDDTAEHLATVVHHLAARGPQWCHAFLEASSRRRVPTESWSEISRLARVSLPLLEHHRLPPPAGDAFAKSWADRYSLMAASASSEERRSAGVAPFRAEAPPAESYRLRIDERGRVQVQGFLLRDTSLAREWEDDPVLADAFSAVINRPGTLSLLGGVSATGWELGPAVSAMVDVGRLERSRVLEDCLQALTRDEPAATQKALATVLDALGFSPQDAKGRVPLLLGAMATARGPVTVVLLPVLLGTVSGPEEMAELAVTVFSRKEKRQRTELLRALVHREAVDRFGRDAVVAGLTMAAECDDESLAERARKALQTLGVTAARAEAPPVADLWQEVPAAGPPPQVQPLRPDAESLTAAASAWSAGAGGHDTAAFLDVFIRWAWQDLRGLTAFVKSTWKRHAWDQPEAARWAAEWAHGAVTEATFRVEVERVLRYHAGTPAAAAEPEAWLHGSAPVTRELMLLHVHETLLAAGSVPCLLSTPSYVSGLVAFDDLLSRLRSYGEAECGELDLFQALLRLEQVDPSRAADLDGLAVRIRGRRRTGLARFLPGAREASADAVVLVRQWVRGGGLPELMVHPTQAGFRFEPVALPVPMEAFPTLPRALIAGHDPAGDRELSEYSVGRDSTVAVVPLWPDWVVAKAAHSFDQSVKGPAQWLAWLTTAGGRPGLPVHHAVATTLSHADEHCRLLAVDAALTLISQGRFDTALFERACLRLLERGELRLARTAAAWEQVVLGGGMRPLWPAVMAVVEAACRQDRRPAGLAELLAVARRYAAAAPGAVVPPAVAAIAQTKGTSKVHVEARAWVRDAEALA
jgi:hypothetical protein